MTEPCSLNVDLCQRAATSGWQLSAVTDDPEITAMPDRADKLRHCTSRFERLLREQPDHALARVYIAETATDRAWLDQIEPGLATRWFGVPVSA